MTKKEALQVLAILKAAYPDKFYGVTEKDALGIVTVWAVQFADMSADIVLMAVNKWISSNNKVPTVADIKGKIETIHWEAYDIICQEHRMKNLSEDKKNLYKRIYKETENFKYSRMTEPSLTQLIERGSGEGVKMIE